MNAVLVDTSCIVAFLDRSQMHHERCVDALASLDAALVTCEAVIVESCWLLRKQRGAVAAVLQNVERGIFQMPFRLAERAEPVRRLIAKYANVPAALADACLIDLASELRAGRILTLDADFKIYRWAKNRPFEILPDVHGS